jgi:hypothetical protein
MTRVVIDTNVLVSALLTSDDSGKAADAMPESGLMSLWSHRRCASQQRATLTIIDSSNARGRANPLPRYREHPPFPRGLERNTHCDTSRLHRCLNSGSRRLALTVNGTTKAAAGRLWLPKTPFSGFSTRCKWEDQPIRMVAAPATNR